MHGTSKSRVIVALSGGVDSAVAALCLLRDGHAVEALHMTNWDDADEHCTAGSDLADARRVCDDLGIPLHHVNFAREYREEVFADFLAELRAGRTPNPDIACNRYIKFGAFLRHALRLGADMIGTGHYARVTSEPVPRLLRAADADKDQTYFLHAVESGALARSLFPLGGLQKDDVRHLARDFGLGNHGKRDSTGICFVGERPFREFLGKHVPHAPGPIITVEGRVVGEHIGLPFYTLGQRQGLKVGGQVAGLQSPWFVAGKDHVRNALVLVQGHDHPLLLRHEIAAAGLRWVACPPPGLDRGIELEARIRHRQQTVPCVARSTDGDRVMARFATAQRAPAPGQYLVFYRGDECLGGGVILADTDSVPATRQLTAATN